MIITIGRQYGSGGPPITTATQTKSGEAPIATISALIVGDLESMAPLTF